MHCPLNVINRNNHEMNGTEQNISDTNTPRTHINVDSTIPNHLT